MSGSGKGSGGRVPPDLQAALERLEKAVHKFAATAKREFAGRAASFIEETAATLERELGGESAANERSSAEREPGPGRRRRQARPGRHGDGRKHRNGRNDRNGRSGRNDRGGRGSCNEGARPSVRPLSRKLYRDREHAKIAGVCAGIAAYFGAEVWVVRCVAVTGLIFVPSVIFPAYWIMYFVMSRPPDNGREQQGAGPEQGGDHTSPAPELGPQLSPRRSLRNLRAALAQAELRLRRMESHVTSGQYELQKELNRLDTDAAGTGG